MRFIGHTQPSEVFGSNQTVVLWDISTVHNNNGVPPLVWMTSPQHLLNTMLVVHKHRSITTMQSVLVIYFWTKGS